jgi:hypothetical protein
VRRVDHRSDIQQCHAPLVQVVVNVIRDLLRLPTPREVVTDEVCLTDKRLSFARYASSCGVVAFAIPVLIINAEPAMARNASLVSARRVVIWVRFLERIDA